MNLPLSGPLAGDPLPLHGGTPGAGGCNGCVDCCHLPEKSVTDDEAARLRELYGTIDSPLGDLVLTPDPENAGWQIMHGACVFRRQDTPLAYGGCRIYDDRPGTCVVFTCPFLLELRRSGQ